LARKQSPSALSRATASGMALASGSALGGATGLRERMLELAGVTEHEQAVATRASITRLTDALNATRVQRLVVNHGRDHSEVREFLDIDHMMRIRAAAEMLDRLGVQVSKSSSNVNNIGSLTVIVTKREPPTLVVDAEDIVVQPLGVLPNPA
jgi:hypothetical protein